MRERLGILVSVLLLAVLSGPETGAGAQVEWTADYRLLFDGTDYYGADVDFVIVDAALSADGSRAAVGGFNESTDQWSVHILPTNGGAGTVVALPADPSPDRPTMRIQNLCLDGDGSRIFFITPWYQYRIFKVEGGVASEILNYTDHAALDMPTDGQVRATADGEWLYFNEDRDDLYRVAHGGGLPERVIDDAAITTAGGFAGWAIGAFDISSDGSEAVFVLSGYRDGGTIVRYDAYSLEGGTVHQLTDDATSEGWPTISADGSTVAFRGADGWTTAGADGTGTAALVSASYNVAGCDLSGDGGWMVYSDFDADRGRLVATDGSGYLDVFPEGSPVYIEAVYHFGMSDDAAMVGFGYTTRTYYVGHLGTFDPTFPGPTISNVTLDPPAMAMADPTGVVLTMQVGHPGGLGEIAAVGAEQMLGGDNHGDWADMMLSFPFAPNDGGTGPDVTAGDGVYSATGDPAGTAGTAWWQRIRTAAQDQTGHVRVVDVWYPACPAVGCAILVADFEEGDFAEWSAVVGGP